MAGKVEMVFTVSEKAARLVKAGKASVKSGGIRNLNGTILELAEPALKEAAKGATNNLTSPISMVSSIAGNVQSVFIQHGVNKANVKLDTSLEKLGQIQKTLEALPNANMVGMVNCAFGMINCGISVAGFYMTLKKLDEVKGTIENLADKFNIQANNDRLEKFEKYCMFIRSDIGLLKDYNIENLTNIPEHLNEIAAYLSRTISEVKKKEIDVVMGCGIVFNLSAAFAQEVKEYAAQYYYKTGTMPPNYQSWIDILNKIDSDDFKEYIKKYLIFECLDMPAEQKYAIYAGAFYGIEYQLGLLEFNKELITRIEKKDYVRLDDFLERKIKENEYFESEGRVCIPI